MRQSKNFLLLLGRLIIGIIFVYAGFTKLTEPAENFRAILGEYSILPKMLIPWIALFIPWAEFLGGVFLVAGYLTRAAALFLTGLNLSLVVFLALSFGFGTSPADCGCFGTGGIHLSPHQMLMVDLMNGIIGICLIRASRHPFAVENLFEERSSCPKTDSD
ncbi:MAG TPA: MauE/DoxX family redox-associated membrane protein [Candidatus Omnitrophota bacterium]|nr:MauE/DoxX family redox-associated membrane protein [Candidatus Omnitrophota bacterium]